ncbi:hypothetical protein ABPG75_006644 [Micractinium tetrahymenae]
MARLALLPVVLLGLACATQGSILPSWYSCDCSARDNCACPTTKPPGGLAPEDVPQFILFTHDDAIVDLTDRSFREICDGRKNPDGCPFRATMFTQAADTDCQLAKKLYEDGYEIATHTANHIAMPAGFPRNDTVAEILGARSFLSQECGIPEADIRGFRNPYLKTNPVVRQVLYENGFLYDSTLMEGPDTESISSSMGARAWPYTFDFGVAQNCEWFSDTQTCTPEERYPGLWEVPLWVLEVLGLEFTMDVGYYGGRGVYEPLMAAFEAAYRGNRAPLPIFVHTTWVEKNPSRLHELKDFADYTMGKPDVYWVTMFQLLAWMRNPIPASELRKSGGALCARAPPPAPAPALPRTGANVTLSLAGMPTQVADQKARLEAAVAALLGAGVNGSPFVAEAKPTAAPAPAAASASGSAAADAGAGGSSSDSTGSVGAKSVQESGAGGSWVPLEGPSHVTYSAGGSGTLGARSMDAESAVYVQVTLAAAGSDPLALYQHAAQPTRRAALAKALSAMGLEPAGEPVIVPVKDGVVMPFPSPPAALPEKQAASTPPPAATPTTHPAAGVAAAPAPAATPEAAAGAGGGNSSSASSSSGSSGLSAGAIAGIAVGGVAVVAAAAGLGYWRRRREERRRAAGCSTNGPAAVPASKGTTPEGSVSIAVTAA